jgi:hypothetical protein
VRLQKTDIPRTLLYMAHFVIRNTAMDRDNQQETKQENDPEKVEQFKDEQLGKQTEVRIDFSLVNRFVN